METTQLATIENMWEQKVMLEEIKKLYGKDLTQGEWQIFIQVGRATKLSPYLKEIWAVKYGNNPAQIFVGRDGYRKGAQANPDYEYHQVDAVYTKDEFKVEKGEIVHSYSLTDRGTLVGAYCSVKRRNSSKPIFCYVELSEYNTGKSLWLTKKATMIKKVAEAQGLRMAFQELFAGTYDEDEVKAGGVSYEERQNNLEDMQLELIACTTKEQFDVVVAKLKENKMGFLESELDTLRTIATEKIKQLSAVVISEEESSVVRTEVKQKMSPEEVDEFINS